MKRVLMVLLFALVAVGGSAVLRFGPLDVAWLFAAASPAEQCQAAKLVAAGKYADRRATCYAAAAKKGVTLSSDCTTKASEKLVGGFAKAEEKAAGACLTSTDAAATQNSIDTRIDAIAASVWDGTASVCVTVKLQAVGTYIAQTMKAYSNERKSDDGARGLKLAEKADTKVLAAFSKANARRGCESAIDSSLKQSAEAVALSLTADLYPRPLVTSGEATFSVPLDEINVGAATVTEVDPGVTVAQVPTTADGGLLLDTFHIVIIDNPGMVPLSEWFANNVDEAAVLLAAGTYSSNELSDGRELMIMDAGAPDSYGGPPLPYAFVSGPSKTKIGRLTLSQDHDLDELGFDTPEKLTALLHSLLLTLELP